ncbi:hypothetical protein NDA11_002805 [Ustilago hordei]|nr:hypothetical protein NDA15_003533 [Ustilago hordei]KAJ1575200.1 hypothetical protein NDA11_002805 [Ustilago hordei]KAJ1575670.1 hypothetical protein NDA12_001917 [Ustilago hordei]
MPRQISDAYHHTKEWLTSTTGAPLRAAYDFLFPPLDDLFSDDAASSNEMGWRASSARRAVYQRSASNSASSASNFNADETVDRLDIWDSLNDSPWSFMISRYAFALVIVAIVNNRVQHICRPRRGAMCCLSQLQRIALRLPSLILLARSVLILTIVVADAFLVESNLINLLLRSCTTASWRNAWLANTPMSGWAQDRFGASSRDELLRARDASALWAAFTSTCVAVVSDSMVRNLDADRDEPPAFNLVGFAFLLHFHSFSPDAPANEHVYLCVLLQMLQILTIALSRCRRPVYASRLVISSLFGIGSLLHYALAANSGRYPFLEALSRTPEIALVMIVLLTVTLHALTMLLLEGSIERDRLVFSRSNLPCRDEDWSLALFKLGTACMESTRLTGLEREVEPLVAWDAPYIELSPSGRIQLVDPLLVRSSASHLTSETTSSLHRVSSGGLSREVKQVRIEPTGQNRSSSTLGHAGLSRVRALIQFFVVTLLVLRNLAMMIFRKILRITGLPDPSVPRSVYRTLGLARLVWHGRNGEARRRERQAAEARRHREHRDQQQRYRQQHQIPTLTAGRSEQAQLTTTRSLFDLSRFYPSESAFEEAGFTREDTWSLQARPGLDNLASRTQGNDRVQSMQVARSTSDSDMEEDEYNEVQDELEVCVGSEEDDDQDSGWEQELQIQTDELSGLLQELGLFAEQDSMDSNTMLTQLTLGSEREAFNRLLLAHLTRPRHEAPLTRSGYNSLVRFSTGGPDECFSTCASFTPTATVQADLDLAQSLINRRRGGNSLQGLPSRSGEDQGPRLTPVQAFSRLYIP